jgi:hypothetical protein
MALAAVFDDVVDAHDRKRLIWWIDEGIYRAPEEMNTWEQGLLAELGDDTEDCKDTAVAAIGDDKQRFSPQAIGVICAALNITTHSDGRRPQQKRPRLAEGGNGSEGGVGRRGGAEEVREGTKTSVHPKVQTHVRE